MEKKETFSSSLTSSLLREMKIRFIENICCSSLVNDGLIGIDEGYVYLGKLCELRYILDEYFHFSQDRLAKICDDFYEKNKTLLPFLTQTFLFCRATVRIHIDTLEN